MSLPNYIRTWSLACKIAAFVLIAAATAWGAGEPVYDTFAQALSPFASAVFGGSEGQPRAFVAECVVESASGKLAAAEGMRLRLALQSPDHLRADLAYNGQLLTACRAGNELWALPEAPLRALALAAGIDVEDTEPDQSSPPLIPLALNPQLLVFLPAVFDVKDLGNEDIGGTPHRVIEFELIPQLRKAIKAEPFTARAWLDAENHPRRVVVSGDNYTIQVGVDKLTFTQLLPTEAWQPAPDQKPLRLPASALNELFEKMLGQKIALPEAAKTP